MATYRARLAEFQAVLLGPEIDKKRLYSLCSHGVPDQPGMRSTCWKILLNYLPYNTTHWPETLQKQRELYKQFIQELIIIPGAKRSKHSAAIQDH
ncbi:TBC1 domain family member 13-like, partial [Saccoglossus kowalevskii]